MSTKRHGNIPDAIVLSLSSCMCWVTLPRATPKDHLCEQLHGWLMANPCAHRQSLRSQDLMGDDEAQTTGGASDTAARVAEAVQAAMDALPAQQQAATLDAEMAQPPTGPASGSPVQGAAAG